MNRLDFLDQFSPTALESHPSLQQLPTQERNFERTRLLGIGDILREMATRGASAPPDAYQPQRLAGGARALQKRPAVGTPMTVGQDDIRQTLEAARNYRAEAPPPPPSGARPEMQVQPGMATQSVEDVIRDLMALRQPWLVR